jgi:hypothetical protein
MSLTSTSDSFFDKSKNPKILFTFYSLLSVDIQKGNVKDVEEQNHSGTGVSPLCGGKKIKTQN